ncbi:TetR family transcriptional regulator [Vitiosangium sp. GDMCC 1.1324]|uniref:TetR/AcrR family transcriptional regulator n=1 Tax=Vitiosangium sp. (strain GDMCC 1.1324) TaxID=2138576 RepID=UPI000D3A30F8|nr:TetR family transcriptional regulator [Vitiosangium sp. GDMCC 1.1324]PTL84696.1 TetR family transcriptional regulator [Vitiosangium sp. GDMCC 1.1324]
MALRSNRVKRVAKTQGGRKGRPAGSPPNREAILAAARAQFTEHGYNNATIRGIAADAGVDPALVLHYFESKERLFSSAMELAIVPTELIPQLIAEGSTRLGERLLRTVLASWEKSIHPVNPMVALLRSATGHEAAVRMLREYINKAVSGRVTTELGVSQPRLRAALIGSQLIGLAMARFVLQIEPLASADTELLVGCYAPVLQRYLTGPLPGDA